MSGWRVSRVSQEKATRKGKSFHARVIPLLFFPQEPENWSYQYSSLSSFNCRFSVPLLAVTGFILEQRQP
ncbi:hypothetical protein CMV_012033 [Castanea mollissima]|uniref:Uncharacterized protein n=1 Tax=Castanea mollissima TaxID=60419 RepID=A0A8J4RFK7_9ROSI|nr:hypothetical protein CMV_012033 [Castanea mollissima]